jgi:hypothetical protein
VPEQIELLASELLKALDERARYVAIIASERAGREAAEAERDRLREVLRENVSDAYNLLTQGESPTQRRQPSARRIYDRARAALAAGTEGEG